MRYFFILFFFLQSFISVSCKCSPLEPISKELSKNYSVIFLGTVDSVSVCGKDGISTAYFTITELYKGKAQQKMKVDFDCATSCLMSFTKGEEWLIYSSYQKFDLLTVNICEHTRKMFNDISQDYYMQDAKRTFEEEKLFLRTTFGSQTFSENNSMNEMQKQLKPHNEQPSGINKILLLVISFITMGVVFYFSGRKK
jgi:hypothetical protein